MDFGAVHLFLLLLHTDWSVGTLPGSNLNDLTTLGAPSRVAKQRSDSDNSEEMNPMRRQTRLAKMVLAGLGILLVGAGVGATTASAKVDSFAGSCSVQGTDTFTPPATNTLQPLTVDYSASGTCSGILEGRNVSNAPVVLHQRAQNVNGSCPYAQTTEPGTGALTFSDGTTIGYSFEFTSVGVDVYLTMRGQRSGSATAHASFLTLRTTPDVVMECGGDGASRVPMDLSLITNSPLVSNHGRGLA
jgi:hypothetical protein